MKNTGLNSIFGLNKLKRQITIDIEACKKTNEIFPNTLVSGIGGLGKTKLATAIAQELNYHLVTIEAAALTNRQKIIDKIIASLKEANNKPLMLFVDEIHRLKLDQQEVFYYPMDKDQPRLILNNKTINIPRFCLMGATTRRDLLDQASFVARFDNVWELEPYTDNWIQFIISDYFCKQNIYCKTTELQQIAKRSLGIPRKAIKIASSIRRYLIALGLNEVKKEHCNYVFDLLGLDKLGLEKYHLTYLRELSRIDGPCGIGALAGKIGQSVDVVAGVIEPTLLTLHFVDMTSRGRIITENGKKHLNG